MLLIRIIAPTYPVSFLTKHLNNNQGRVVNCMFGKGFGFIEPDALADGANGRKQLIFFHFRDWTGPIDTRPSSNADVPCKVRYVRVPDQREHGKWKAINVAQRR